MAKAITVVDDEEVPRELLAESIVRISDSFTKLAASGLNRRAIVVLVRHASHLGMRDVALVLNTLEDLKERYCD